MEFETTTLVDVKRYSNCYIVDCELMHGDADGESHIEIGSFKKGEDEDILEHLVRTLDSMDWEYTENYDRILGFKQWFDRDYLTEEEFENLDPRIKSIGAEWENDLTFMDARASYRSHSIYFFDEDGNKYNVKATDNSED